MIDCRKFGTDSVVLDLRGSWYLHTLGVQGNLRKSGFFLA